MSQISNHIQFCQNDESQKYFIILFGIESKNVITSVMML